MLFVKMNGDLPCDISTFRPKDDGTWQSRHHWEDFVTVQRLATYLTAMTGITYLPTDSGSSVWPRFDIMAAPAIGDPVSYSFNGDTYPCGLVTKITKTWQITTSEGKKFRRRGNAPGFRMEGGTWSLVPGHHDERNPSF